MKYLLLPLLLLLTANVNAAFLPTSGSVELFNLEDLLSDAEAAPLFALIEEGQPLGPRVPINFDPFSGAMVPGDQIEFTAVAAELGGGFAFRNADDGAGTALVLPTNLFEIVRFDGAEWVLPDTTTQSGPQAFEILWGQSAGLTVSDVGDIGPTPTAVPVPASMWLFGSGLLGMVGVARLRV